MKRESKVRSPEKGSQGVSIRLTEVPFSRRGCWLNLAEPRRTSEQPLGPGLYLRSNRARGVSPQREHFKLELMRDGRVVSHRVEATAASVVLSATDGSAGHVELIFEPAATLRARGQGIGLRLTCAFPSRRAPESRAITTRAGFGQIDVNLRAGLRRYRFIASSSEMICRSIRRRGVASPVIEVGGNSAVWELAVDEFESAWIERERLPFAASRDEGHSAFRFFCAKLPPGPTRWKDARRLAGYLLWSCTKSPSGFFRREAVLMSLNWMDGVWSWDNVFNALALAGADPSLACDQLLLMVDHQDRLGAYPDRVDELVRHYNFSKPPVQGVLLRELERLHPEWWTPERTRALVESVRRSTCWWLHHRVSAGRSLAHYLHGNDSGWDNSTLFRHGAPLESPDLNALLAVQAGWLADKEDQLGRIREAARWRRVEERFVATLVTQLWDGKQFVGCKLPEMRNVRSRSLVDCIPVVLGGRLPTEIAGGLVRRIRTFVTPAGIATEQTTSPYYEPDGYWRGPVWGASTYLVILGLEAMGEHGLARTLAHRFCSNCAKNGFAENFNAVSGAALRDTAYTWTSSVFLLLLARARRRPVSLRGGHHPLDSRASKMNQVT